MGKAYPHVHVRVRVRTKFVCLFQVSVSNQKPLKVNELFSGKESNSQRDVIVNTHNLSKHSLTISTSIRWLRADLPVYKATSSVGRD
jgi:hypothetical protein